MEYKLFLTDSAGTHELPPLDVPLTRLAIEKMTTVEPLSGNVYDDFISTKRSYAQTWRYLTEAEYALLEEIYNRMKEELTYPRLTVQGEGESINLLTVKFDLGAKNIINDCGDVQDVTISMRESRQLGS